MFFAGSRMQARTFRLSKVSDVPGGLADLLIATLFINVLSLALPLALLQIYDRILPNASVSTLGILIAGVVVALALEAGLKMARSYISGWMGARFDHLAGSAALQHLFTANIVDFERQGAGVHLERLGALSVVREFYSGQAILVLCDLPFAVVYLLGMYYLAGALVWVPLGLIALFVAAALLVGDRLHKALQARGVADDRRFSFVIEVLEGIHTVKSMAMEKQLLRRYERLQEACVEADRKAVLHGNSAQGIGSIFSQATAFCVVGFGSMLVIDGSLTTGGLVACTMLAGRSMQPLQKAVGTWTRMQTIRLARGRLYEIFGLRSEGPADRPPMPPIEGALELRNVSFHYGANRDGKNLPFVLKDANIMIEPGEAIGIFSGNASGKSTLLSMMAGLLQPTEGAIFVDGQDLSLFEPTSIRSHIAYLPVDGVVFSGTILENITMFRPDRERAAVHWATVLGLTSVISQLPLGFDTRMGSGAPDAVSRGIRQRIAIARALVDGPRIVLFDEANTGLDIASDAVLLKALEDMKGHCTLVLVSHRPSILKLVNRVFEIRDAALVPRQASKKPQPPVPAGEPVP